MALGALISAGSSLLGGFLGKKQADKDRDRAAQQVDIQREFAQKGIQWKVADAKAAGIHPLYALGANTPSFSPTIQATPSGSSMAAGLSQAGQNIGRAVSANQTHTQRMMKLAEEKLQSEIELTKAHTTNINRQQLPKAFPHPGEQVIEGQAGAIKTPALPSTSEGRMLSGSKLPVFNPELGDLESMGFPSSFVVSTDYLLNNLIPYYKRRSKKNLQKRFRKRGGYTQHNPTFTQHSFTRKNLPISRRRSPGNLRDYY